VGRRNLQEQDRLRRWSIDAAEEREGGKKRRLGASSSEALTTASRARKREAMENEGRVAEGDVKLAHRDRVGVVFGKLERGAREVLDSLSRSRSPSNCSDVVTALKQPMPRRQLERSKRNDRRVLVAGVRPKAPPAHQKPESHPDFGHQQVVSKLDSTRLVHSQISASTGCFGVDASNSSRAVIRAPGLVRGQRLSVVRTRPK